MSKCKHCDKTHKNDNTGCKNSGNMNSGSWNSGYMNSGHRNSGDWNSGNMNSGDRNSGSWNSGDWNSGYRNSGDRNSGSWNSGNMNSGYMNTNSPDKIRVFNTWVDMTHNEFNEKYNIYADLPINRWIEYDDMSEKEKNEIKVAKDMGGYLKKLEFKEACVIWWRENPDRHNDFLSLPNFDADIFKEITGIDVDMEPQEMTLAEVCKELGRNIKIIKD